jgi:hypothetical protein
MRGETQNGGLAYVRCRLTYSISEYDDMLRPPHIPPPAVFLFGMAVLGTILATLAFLSMRVARHRVYAEVAASCSQISLLTLNETRYFCAPVARIEGLEPERPRQGVTRL